MKSLKAQIYVAVVCVVLGLMLAYQFQAVKNAVGVARNQKLEELSAQLSEAQKQKLDLEKNIKELDKTIESYEQEMANSGGVASALKNELDRVKTLAGLTEVEGPGISITVNPVEQELGIDEPAPIDFRALLLIINELNASGAEAIMINKQRIVSTTQIRTAGYTIIINGVRFSATDKFEIDAIGNPTTLEGAMNFPSLKDDIEQYYFATFKTKKADKITILKYNKIPEYKFAKPVKEGE